MALGNCNKITILMIKLKLVSYKALPKNTKSIGEFVKQKKPLIAEWLT